MNACRRRGGGWPALGLLLVGCAAASPLGPRPLSPEERAQELAHALLTRELAALDSSSRTRLLLERTRSDAFPDVVEAVSLLARGLDNGTASPPSALLLGDLLVEPDGSVRLWHHAARAHDPLGAPWRTSIGPAGFAAIESAVSAVARSCPRAPRPNGATLFRVAQTGACGGWVLSWQELRAAPWAELHHLAGCSGEQATLAERATLADRVEAGGLDAAELFVVESSGHFDEQPFVRSFAISAGRWRLRESTPELPLQEREGVLGAAQRAALQASLLTLLRTEPLSFPMVDGGVLRVTLRRGEQWVDFYTAPELRPGLDLPR